MPKAQLETPPLVERLFGEDWEDLDNKPDCWNRMFGPDTSEDKQVAAYATSAAVVAPVAATSPENCKELCDQNWIKQQLEGEIVRFVVEVSPLYIVRYYSTV
jgi:hypothetical protein